MIKRLVGIILAVSGLPMAAGWAQPLPPEPEEVVIRASTALPDAAIEYIATVGLPTEMPVARGERTEPILQKLCGGSYSDTWRKKASEQTERLLEPIDKARTLSLPPCVSNEWKPSVLVLEGDTFAALLRRETGFETDHVLIPCPPPEGVAKSRCGKTLWRLTEELNPGLDLGALKPKQSLILPFRAHPVTVRLMPGVTAADFQERLDSLLRTGKSKETAGSEGQALPSLPALDPGQDRAQPLPGQPEQVVIRPSSALPDAAIEYIATVGLPTEIDVAPNEKTEKVLQDFCGGSYSDTWRKKASEQTERLLEPIDKARTLSLPPCVRNDWKPSVLVLEGDTFAALLRRETGFETDHVLIPCPPPEGVAKSRCGKTLWRLTEELNPGLDLAALAPGQSLILPLGVRSVTVKLKPGITATDFKQQLARLLRTEEVVIRASPTLSDAAIEYIATVGLPTEIDVAPNAKTEKVLQDFCGGSYSDTWRKKASEQNERLLEPIGDGRVLRLPPCVNTKSKPDVSVHERDTFETLLKRETGFAPNHVLTTCSAPKDHTRRCGKTLRQLTEMANPGRDLDALMPGQSLNLPIATRLVTVRLTPGVTVTDFKKQLAILQQPNATSSQISRIDEGGVASLPEGIDGATASQSCVPDKEIGNAWPFDSAEVAKALRWSAAEAKQRGLPMPRITVGVIDVGFNGVGAGDDLPKELLAIVENGTRTGELRYGYTAKPQRETLADYTDYDYRDHGTPVAKMVLGGDHFFAQYPDLNQHIQMYVVQALMPVQNRAAFGDNLPTYRYEIDQADVVNGLRASPPPLIVNLSIGSKTVWPSLRDRIDAMENLLVVAAAGNEHSDLSVHPWIPANFGGSMGTLKHQVITVGASNGSLKPAGFSNHFSGHIDIWAPGCNVPVSSSGTTIPRTGTSFAAPQVTFTAMLIRSMISADPKTVKDRIIASADYVTNRAFEVGTGILNIERALYVFDDVVEDTPGALAPGRWMMPPAVCKGRDYSSTTIRRIVPRRSADGKLVYADGTLVPKGEAPLLAIWRSIYDGGLVSEECTADEAGGIRFISYDDPTTGAGAEDQTIQLLTWDETISLTPSMVPPPN